MILKVDLKPLHKHRHICKYTLPHKPQTSQAQKHAHMQAHTPVHTHLHTHTQSKKSWKQSSKCWDTE